MSALPSFEGIELEIANIMETEEAELSEEARACLEEYIDMLAGQEAEKIDGFCQFMRLQAARCDAIRAEASRLYKKAQAMEGRMRWLKEHYLAVMLGRNLKRIRGNAYTLTVRNSTRVEVDHPELLEGTEYARVKLEVSPDKQAIKNALRQGELIPGCRLVEDSYLSIS